MVAEGLLKSHTSIADQPDVLLETSITSSHSTSDLAGPISPTVLLSGNEESQPTQKKKFLVLMQLFHYGVIRAGERKGGGGGGGGVSGVTYPGPQGIIGAPRYDRGPRGPISRGTPPPRIFRSYGALK